MQQLPSTRIVFGAFMASIVMYAVVLWMFRQSATLQFPAGLEIMKVALGGVWLTSLIILFTVVEPSIVRSIQSNTDLPAKYQSVVIIRGAFLESGAIYGLVLGMLGAPFQIFAIYAGAAFVLMLLKFPSDSDFQRFQDTVSRR